MLQHRHQQSTLKSQHTRIRLGNHWSEYPAQTALLETWDPPASNDGPEDNRDRRWSIHCHYKDCRQDCSCENKGLPSLYVQHIMHLSIFLNLSVSFYRSLVMSLDRTWTPRQDGLVEGHATVHSSPESCLLNSTWCLLGLFLNPVYGGRTILRNVGELLMGCTV
jgi:hypothetical protein